MLIVNIYKCFQTITLCALNNESKVLKSEEINEWLKNRDEFLKKIPKVSTKLLLICLQLRQSFSWKKREF